MRAWAGEGSVGGTGHATGRVSVYSQRGQTRRNTGKSGVTSHHSTSQSDQSVISIIPLLAPLTADDL